MRTLIFLVLSALIACDRGSAAPAPAPVKHGNLPINGVTYHYEIHGQGEPLLLLHGGLMSTATWGEVLPTLARGRQVIGVDLHGHGRTPLGTRKISLIDQGDDLAALLGQLGYDKVDVLGYSFGGGVALRLAIQHPDKVRRLIVVSAPFAQDGFYPEMLPQQAAVSAALAPMMKDTPMYKSYAAIAPDPGEFPRLLDRMGELMRTPYDWAADVERLGQSPVDVMLIFGDSDMVRIDHIAEFYRRLGGGQRDAGWAREHIARHRLAIIPDVTHYEMFMSSRLVDVALPFLGG